MTFRPGMFSSKRQKKTFIALGSRLSGIPEVITLGVRPNFLDYPAPERELIHRAEMILYPTRNYAQFFTTAGKRLFPSLETYLYSDEKIKQTTLFYLLGIPHPRTRIYYHLHFNQIPQDFSFPFIGKLPRNSARGRGVFKIHNRRELEAYLAQTSVAYIQEYLPHDRDLRVLLLNYESILVYWRYRCLSNFRTNLAQGGVIGFEDLPEDGIRVALEAAKKCKFNDVGMDLIHCKGKWFVIEANMKYGRSALKMKGLDLKEIIRQKLISGEIMG